MRVNEKAVNGKIIGRDWNVQNPWKAVRVKGPVANPAQAVEKAAEVIFCLCAFTAVAAVCAMTLYMIANGVPAVLQTGLKEILFSKTWNPTAKEPSFGIFYVILK